ncbi:MAG: IPTL-CTERM sorting domain-containing protein [Thermoanaerobaculia bacterium]
MRRHALVIGLLALCSVAAQAATPGAPASPKPKLKARAAAIAAGTAQPRSPQFLATHPKAAKRAKKLARLANRDARHNRANEHLRPKNYSHDHVGAPGLPTPFGTDLLNESFSAGIPAGWAVLDNTGSGVVWTNLAGCGETSNYTGATGDVACASSDFAGFAEYDTELRTPVLNFTGFTAPATLTFIANYQNFANFDFFDVDVSINGAAGPWTTLQSWNEDHGGDHAPPGAPVSLDVSSVAGQANVMFRFHYYDPTTGDFDWYVQVDDVVVTATPGGGGACTLTCPADQNVGTAPGLCSATVNYPGPTIGGQCGSVVCTPVSGGSFNLGSTLVTCSEQGPPPLVEGQPLASCTFNVNVADTEPPAISCPANQSAPAPGVLNYPAPTATDNCTAPPPVDCAPPSGSNFPAGTTPVNCTATDAATLTATCGFSMLVGGAPPIVEVPTMSTYGLASLALLLVGAAFLVLRRQH